MKSLWVIALILAGTLVVAGCDNDDPTAICDDNTVEYSTPSSGYLNHRFFKLDLPLSEPGGRDTDDHIVQSSIKIFKMIQASQPSPGDIVNVATYVDSLGFLNWDNFDFQDPYRFGPVWREITAFVHLRDVDGQLIAVDLLTQMEFEDILAVIYEVRRADGTIVKVGDRPGIDVPYQTVNGGNGFYFRMKLLKAEAADREPHTFGYVLRNVYSLGSTNINAVGFSLRIERLQAGISEPWKDENGVGYLRIFGLDRDNPLRTGIPDGLVDVWDPFLINLEKGLLTFPVDFPTPFAPGGNPTGRAQEADMMAEAVYTANADTAAFFWDPSYLRDNQSWQIYDPEVNPGDYPQYGAFEIIATFEQPEDDDP